MNIESMLQILTRL